MQMGQTVNLEKAREGWQVEGQRGSGASLTPAVLRKCKVELFKPASNPFQDDV